MDDEDRVEEGPTGEPEPEYVEPVTFGHEATAQESVHIETGRGQTTEVQSGAPFVATIERVADEAHYGGYFRVFLNGDELIENPWLDEGHTEPNPSYPTTIELGMRIAITSYDKVG